jgi:hypothetical protein
MEIKSRKVVKGAINVDIGCGTGFGGGDEDEKVEDSAETVIDLIDNYRYQETSFDKKSYASYIKAYMKKIKVFLDEKKPDRVEGFMKGAQELVKWILEKFDEFTL